jgi:hypothetical protein
MKRLRAVAIPDGATSADVRSSAAVIRLVR